MTPFLAIHAKGGESISPKQKDRTTTYFKKKSFSIGYDSQLINFKIGILLCSKGGET
jgi:putative salt-induced outer membrane protein YdiY